MLEALRKRDSESLPIRRYSKRKHLQILETLDAAKKVVENSEEETAIVSGAVSEDNDIRDAASLAMVYRFRYIEKFEQGKTTSAEDYLISLAVDIYMHRPTSSSLLLKRATQDLVLRQLDSFYKIEAQNFYRKSGDHCNTLEDYRQEAAMCIFERLDQYNPRKGKLSTYFKQQFYGKFVLLQTGNRKKYYAAQNIKIDRAKAALAEEGINNPTNEQIAQWINTEGGSREVSAQQVETAMKSRVVYMPLESICELQSLIPGTEEAVCEKDQNERLQKAAKELDPVLQVVYVTWMRSLEETGNNISDRDLKAALKKKYPQMTDRDIMKAKTEFARQMRRKLGDKKSARRTTEKIRNIAEADLSLFDAIEKQYPDGLPDMQ